EQSTLSVEEHKSVQEDNTIQDKKSRINMLKDVNQEEYGGPFHKVLLKNVMVNGERLKTFYCLSCKIHVSDLEEFKNRPCDEVRKTSLKYSCVLCPAAYDNSKSLCAHMKVHKTRSTEAILPSSLDYFLCEICNTFFSTNKSLKLHKRMHDPVKSRPIIPPVETEEGHECSPDSYICPVCDKVIPVDYKTIHQNSHKTDEQMNCGICNKKFTSKEYLDMHMNVHNIDKVKKK
ncbi:hypothetical protein ACJJTC_015391, partial [Scirpophaga incertulas]